MTRWAPQGNPSIWFVINITCLTASFVTLVDLLVASDYDLSERPTAQALYLLWNFGTTAVWCAEIGLSAAFIVLQQQQQESTSSSWNAIGWDKRLELLLALYFTADSAHLLWKWKIKKQKLDEELGDACLSLLGYFYTSYETYQQKRQRQQEGSSEEQSTVDESTSLVV